MAAAYELRAGGRNDASAYTYTPWTVITDAAHWVELDWQAATAAGANNGAVALWIDQVAAGSVTTLDNDTRAIDTARLGAVNGLDAGTTGTLYFDAFENRRVHTTIGTEASLPDRLFTNSFESNSLANWVVYGAGITTTTAANLAPGQSIGAAVAVTSTQTNRYLEDLTPNRESRYRARVYFDPNGLTMAVNNSFNLLNIYTGTTEIGRLEFQYVATGYRLRGAVRNDASAYTYTPWTTLTDSAHVLEIDWRAATGPGANNGGLTLWIDGTQVGALSGVDNDTRRVDRARIGAVGLAAGTTGTFYLDAFESRRESAIGPVQVAGSALTTTAITYGYDPLYRLTSASYSDGTLFGYQYDAVGNVLTKTQTISGTPATQTYAYDDANRQTSAAGLAQTYDNNGNLLNDGTTAYTWDGANRMTASGSTAYTYNGLNDRVSAGGVTHQLDLNTGLTQVLADGTNTYLYGAGRLGEQQGVAWQYHLADGLGSVRQLADASGAVSAAKSYEPYGEVLNSAGTASSVYGFTGEQHSGNLVYLRARYYQAEAMRFASRDAFAGNPTAPASLNRWLYAFANVMNRTDPSGYYPGCLRDARNKFGFDPQKAMAACARMRVGEIAARQQNWLTFGQLFSDRELNGSLAGAAGRTVEQRIIFILNLAGNKHVWAKKFGPSDCFLREEFRDSQFYEYTDPQVADPKDQRGDLWDPKPDKQGFSNQIGHFLDAVSWTRTMGNASRQAFDQFGGGAAGLDAAMTVYRTLIAGIVGHELSGDNETSGGGLEQTARGAWRDIFGELTWGFAQAVEYDALGRTQARDRILARIVFGSEDTPDSYFDLHRTGNSIQDLRLTVKGYRFGLWSLGNSAPPTGAVSWLRNNLIVRRNGPTR